jgi:hypothetical protein
MGIKKHTIAQIGSTISIFTQKSPQQNILTIILVRIKAQKIASVDEVEVPSSANKI